MWRCRTVASNRIEKRDGGGGGDSRCARKDYENRGSKKVKKDEKRTGASSLADKLAGLVVCIIGSSPRDSIHINVCCLTDFVATLSRFMVPNTMHC